MKAITIFIDSDVVIASMLSFSGASHYLLHMIKQKMYISTYSQKELQIVMERLGIEINKLERLEKDVLKIVTLHDRLEQIKKEYMKFVLDENDAHIVAGAAKAKAKFLITYNTKDFKNDAIKDAFGCIVTTPANFLQYLRSV